jgi:hypothetical protein
MDRSRAATQQEMDMAKKPMPKGDKKGGKGC